MPARSCCGGRCRRPRRRGSARSSPEAIREVEEQARPDARDADELHDLLLDVGFLPASEGEPFRGFLEALLAGGRAARARLGGREVWVAAERAGAWRALAAEPGIDASPLDPPLPELEGEDLPASPDVAAARALRGWLARIGPVTAPSVSARLGLPEPLTVAALHRLESEGLVLRGSFLPGGEPGADWCDRGLLARIHRLTLGRLRREIEPVSGADLVRFLLRWQHAAPGARLHGARGVAEVIGQLQGFHAAAGAWEREILPARVTGYEPGLLDALCLSGEVAWGRLAVATEAGGAPRRRAAPTRHAPVTLALRTDLPWLLSAPHGDPPPLGASARALVRPARALRRLLPPRPRRHDRALARRGGGGALGARLGGARHLRRLRRSPRPPRPAAAPPPAPARPGWRTLGAPAPSAPRRRPDRPVGARAGGPPAPRPLGRGLSRPPRARAARTALAGAPARLPGARGPGRDPRRSLRGRSLRRAVRAARRRRGAARRAARARGPRAGWSSPGPIR